MGIETTYSLYPTCDECGDCNDPNAPYEGVTPDVAMQKLRDYGQWVIEGDSIFCVGGICAEMRQKEKGK